MSYRLKIERFLSGGDWTIGEFRLIDKDSGLCHFNGFTLEPAGPDEVRSGLDRRIPQGVYNAVFEYSPKFNRNLPVLFNENVAKSRRILIHTGNTGVDTAGCILIGNEWSANGKVFNSINTINTLFSKLKMKDFEVEIKNKFLM